MKLYKLTKLLITSVVCTVFNLSLISTIFAMDPPPINDIFISNNLGEVFLGTRCATKDEKGIDQPDSPGDIQRWRQYNKTRESHITIPVAFHIITKSNGEGDISDERINQQIDVLNKAYANMKINFVIDSINRIKSNFYYNIGPGFSEFLMKMQYNKDPANVLNFYTLSPSGGILGWATLPWQYIDSFFLHGVVVLNESLPGGNTKDFSEGNTGVHEVGHYLGLYHTFQGGCMAPGDSVDDTPYHANANYGCPINSDTCSSNGVDPIHNFMNYTDDACMDHFTFNQSERIDWAIANYKKNLYK